MTRTRQRTPGDAPVVREGICWFAGVFSQATQAAVVDKVDVVRSLTVPPRLSELILPSGDRQGAVSIGVSTV